MFKAELKADTLKGLVYIISTLVDETKITINADSISMKAMDPAHVAMMEIVVDKDAFISYEADETEIGLDLDKIKTVLKLAGPSDTIRMEHDPDQGRLTITIGNIVRRMSVVDTSGMNDPKVPQMELPVSVKIPIDQLQKGIRAAESISDHIKLMADPNGFELSCEGDMDYASLRVPVSDLESIVVDSPVTSLYPLDYFSNIVKVIPAGTVVEIQLDNDYPVKFLFNLAEGHARVVYFLAPRIENE